MLHRVLIPLSSGIIGAGVLLIGITYTDQASSDATHAALVRQYQASIAACGRGNILRAYMNTETSVLTGFLVAARTARLAAVAASNDDAVRALNQKAANAYGPLIAAQHPVALVDCAHLYTSP